MRPGHWLYTIPVRLRSLFRWARADQELDEELRDHLERATEEYVDKGMASEEARREALFDLGGIEKCKEECRDVRHVNWIQDFVQDLRCGMRALQKSPGFTAAAVLTLALGIGANTAIFSLVDSALFKPLYSANPTELVSIFWGDPEGHGLSNHSYADYLDYRRDSGSVLSGLAAFTTMPTTLLARQNTERVNVGLVSDNYFSVLGVSLIAGREFLRVENDTVGTSFVAVISENLWREQYGSNSDLRGKTVWLNNSRYSVVGVAPERASRMAGIVKIDVFVPAVMDGVIGGDKDFLSRRENKEFMVIGRLRDGVTLSQTQARFTLIAAELQKQYPAAWSEDGRPHPLSAVPATVVPFELRGMVTGFAGLLLGAVLMVLLVACANLGGFLMARLLARQREIGVRVALGASRRRLIQQLTTENSILALMGGTTGFLIAVWAKKMLAAFAPNIGVPLAIDLSLDYRVLGFSLLVTLLTALALGLAPAMQATRANVLNGLKAGEPGKTTDYGRSRLRNVLIVGQVALSLVLLMSAAIFLGSFGRLHSVNLGFDPNNLALLSVDLGMDGRPGREGPAFISQSIARLQNAPGSEAVAVAAHVPMGLSRVREQVAPDAQEQRPTWIGFNMVGPRYFQVMRIPLLRGRVFTEQEADDPSVAVVNDTLANLFWPHQDPIGRRMKEPGGKTFEVVGVVKTGKYDSLDEDPVPYAYFPLDSKSARALTFQVRTRVPAATVLGAFREELRAADPAIPVFDVETMSGHLADSILPVRVGLILLGAFGGLALALASIGLYGSLSYTVRQRTSEIGIRMALGASPRKILKTIMGRGVRLTAYGIAIGFIIGLATSILIGSQLYGIAPADIAALSGVALTQIGVALLACYVPARRAVRVDPMTALRYE